MNPESEAFLKCLLSGDRKRAATIAKRYLSENSSIKDLYESVFKEALYEVGRLWETNKISVASEHLATAISEGILNELYEQLEIPITNNKKVVLACVEGESHQVGIKMVADVFEMNGWDSYFLGTRIPLEELLKFMHQIKPTVIAISISIYFNFRKLSELITILKNEFPDLSIVVGGQGLQHKSKVENFEDIENVKYLEDLYDLENYLIEN